MQRQTGSSGTDGARMNTDRINRRRVLQLIGAGSLAGAAGCSTGGGDGGSSDGGDGGGSSDGGDGGGSTTGGDGDGGGGSGEETLDIGILYPTSLGFGAVMRAAAKIYATEMNPTVEAGGTTYRYSFSSYDSGCASSAAVNAIEKGAFDDGIKFFVGPVCSQATAATHGWLADLSEDEQVLAVGDSSTSKATSEDMPYYFRVHGRDVVRTPRAVAYMAKMRDGGYDNIGMIAPTSEYGDQKVDPSREAAEALGLNLQVERYPAESKDHRSQLTSLINSDMEILFVVDHPEFQGVSIRQARELGFSGPIQGNTNTSDDRTWEVANGWPNMQDVHATNLWNANDVSGDLKTLLDIYEEQYPDLGVNYFVMEGAGMMATIHHGIREAGSTDVHEVSAAIEEMNVENTVYQSPLKYTPKHDIENPPVFPAVWQEDGSLKTLKEQVPPNPL